MLPSVTVSSDVKNLVSMEIEQVQLTKILPRVPFTEMLRFCPTTGGKGVTTIDSTWMWSFGPPKFVLNNFAKMNTKINLMNLCTTVAPEIIT